MVRTYFDVRGAEALLPSLNLLVRRARQLKVEMDAYQRIIRRGRVLTNGEEEEMDETFDGDLNTLKEEFYNVIEHIESSGAIVRDVNEGILDFYAKFEGKDVFLTWKVGDRKIKYWHYSDESFTNRRRILELK